MKLVPTAEHPSNLDPTARIVAADPLCAWTVYAVRGGFVLAISGGRAALELFATQHDAQTAATQHTFTEVAA